MIKNILLGQLSIVLNKLKAMPIKLLLLESKPFIKVTNYKIDLMCNFQTCILHTSTSMYSKKPIIVKYPDGTQCLYDTYLWLLLCHELDTLSLISTLPPIRKPCFS